jgi:DNA-binding SARP family transcriptional activator
MEAQPALRKLACVLGILGCASGRPVERDMLAGLLWPDSGQSQAYYNLRQTLVQLRKALGPHADCLITPSHAHLALDTARVWIDVVEFDRQAAAGTIEGAARAIALYRGPLLSQLDDEWSSTQREARSGPYAECVDVVAQAYIAERRYPEAVRLLRDALSHDSARESFWQYLMRAYASAGDVTAANLVYRDLRLMLMREFHVDASDQTKELFRSLRELPQPAPTAPAVAPPRTQSAIVLEPLGGAVPLESPFYIEREADRELGEALAASHGIVRVQGAPQTGKTSLLARGLRDTRARAERVVLTDFRNFTAEQLGSSSALMQALAQDLADQLDMDASVPETWSPDLSANRNLERFVRRYALASDSSALIWVFDEVDRVFPQNHCSDVFGLFRSWYNRRALDPGGPWQRLTMVFAYCSETHKFIINPNQSPFNVGTRVLLNDFTPEPIARLNELHGRPLADPAEMARFQALVGGHPYLVRAGLAMMARGAGAVSELEARALAPDSLFLSHLKQIRAALEGEPELVAVVRHLLRRSPCDTPDQFDTLRSLGVLANEGSTPRIRCRLYEQYLEAYLG